MAVYTQVAAEEMQLLVADYGLGTLTSAKGIAEGVENSNYLVETAGGSGAGRFILTLYEKRVDEADLPFFLALIDHLADAGLPVPRALPGPGGGQIQRVAGRPACLIEFLPGISVTRPTPGQARAAGEMLGRMHAAAADFAGERPNALGPAGWRTLAERCGDDLDLIQPGLADRVTRELGHIDVAWPGGLPRAVIHADLFPDNVLMLNERVSGVIDFYFACSEVRAWDLAVADGAWSFSPDGCEHHADVAAALREGYATSFGLTDEEEAAFPTLCRGAALRFLLTRAWDWLNTPADALVTRKDPLAYLRRLEFYAGHAG